MSIGNPMNATFTGLETKIKYSKTAYAKELNYIPIVVFSINAELKVKTDSKVIYSVNLLKAIREYKVESLTDQQKEAIYSKLITLNVSEKETRTQHVTGINQKKAEVAQQLGSNRCPKCWGGVT